MSSRVLLIGGTSDSRAIARALRGAGLEVLISTATEYGAALAASDAESRAGALDASGMAELAVGCAAIVDASHPFARAASEAASEAARIAGIPYVRFERAGTPSAGDALFCASAEDAAHAAVEAAGVGGTVLLTVGSRTLATYAAACREAGVRCVARVLPVAEALSACAEAGLPPSDIVAMQGPTSADLDTALLRHLGATVLVTKDSGSAGGVPAKLEAAQRAGAVAIVVEHSVQPMPDALHSVGEVVAAVLALEGVEPDESAPSSGIGLVHVYTGNGKGKTTASAGLAVRAAGAGLRVAFVQFVKGGRESSELESLRRLGVEVIRPGTASSGLMRGAATQRDSDAVADALAAARTVLSGPFDLVVLDEACVAARSGLLALGDLLGMIQDRASHVEVVCTGRGAPPELIELADYVTELRPLRHPHERGVNARKGIEY
jgi:precorrin-6A/cobalt-precorrin-6A reductase